MNMPPGIALDVVEVPIASAAAARISRLSRRICKAIVGAKFGCLELRVGTCRPELHSEFGLEAGDPSTPSKASKRQGLAIPKKASSS